jgi:hypothetical protein
MSRSKAVNPSTGPRIASPTSPGRERVMRLPPLISGNSRSSCVAAAAISSRACSIVTPGCSRPRTKICSTRRSSSWPLPDSISGSIAIGNQRSGAEASSVPKKPCGATPMMV